MNTYAVKYLDGTELQVAYMQGEGQRKAKEEFTKVYPNIETEKILSVTEIDEKSNDYGVAVLAAKIISFLGWISIFAGIIVLVLALADAAKSGEFGLGTLIALYPVPFAIAGGLILIITGQVSRAVMDNANYSKQMLDEMRNIK